MALEAQGTPRILVVRRDNIGDLVCTTPLIDALRARHPGAHLAALVTTYNAAVLARNPALDAVHLAIDNFARSVRGRTKPAAGALDGLQATVVAIKAHEATLAGGRIELKPEWFTLKAEEE